MSRFIARALFVLCLVSAAVALMAVTVMESALAVVVPMEDTALVGGVLSAVSGLACWRLRFKDGFPWRIAMAAVLGGVVIATIVLVRTVFTFEAIELRFPSGGLEMAGTVYVPRGAESVPGAVLVHGSGRATRGETAFYARFLARRGVAAIVYDKRGSGASEGETYAVGYGGYAADAAAAFGALREQPGVDPDRVGFWGFSEAEWVAPLAAQQLPETAFLVVVGASALSPAGQVREEIELRLTAAGVGADAVEDALELQDQLTRYQRTGEGAVQLREALSRSAAQPWFSLAEDFPTEVYPSEEYGWWRGVMDTDVRPLLLEFRFPMLYLKGTEDNRSDAIRTRNRLREALHGKSREQLAVDVLPGADHQLLRWPLGERIPPPVFSDGYPERVATWIQRATRSPASRQDW